LRLFAKIKFVGSNLSIGNAALLDVWRKQKCGRDKQSAVFSFICQHINDSFLQINETRLKEKARMFSVNLSVLWQKCHRKIDKFTEKYANWMEGNLSLDLIGNKSIAKPKKKLAGRPKITFSLKGTRGQRKDAAALSTAQKHNSKLLIQAASIASRRQGFIDLAAVLKVLALSPTKAKTIRTFLSNSVKTYVRSTAEEALALILDQSLTKDQYCAIREDAKTRNAYIYPHYKMVAEKKKHCRPENITITDTIAKVALQDLLDHTTARIVAYQEDTIVTSMKNQQTTLSSAELILSYGFDGSTGQANYNQAYSNGQPNNDDSSLFASTVTPLRLIDSAGNVLWNNRTPQSIRFCRPLKLEFLKESKAVVILENLHIQEEIKNLVPCQVILNDKQIIYVKFSLYLTVIDAKYLMH